VIAVSVLATGIAMMAAAPPKIIEQRAETGSRLITKNPMPSITVDRHRAAMIRRATMQCVVERQGAVARRVVAASNEHGIDYATLGIPSSRINAALSIETCMERAMNQGERLIQWQVSDSTMRGLLTDALYRTTFKSLPTIDWAREAPRPVVSYSVNGQVKGASPSTMFGECIVQTAPQLSDQFVRSEPDSASEASAATAIVSSIEPCLQAGSTLSLQKAALRVILADALWRFALGTSAATTAKPSGLN
jgi:hypothetical protein